MRLAGRRTSGPAIFTTAYRVGSFIQNTNVDATVARTGHAQLKYEDGEQIWSGERAYKVLSCRLRLLAQTA